MTASTGIGNDVTVKLCDFGWATWWRPGQRRSTLCGTAEFVPPEMLTTTTNDSSHTVAWYAPEFVDRWMLGILAVELVDDTTPFAPATDEEAENSQLTLAKIRRFRGRGVTVRCSDDDEEDHHQRRRRPAADYADFVERLLRYEPEARMSAGEALEHRFLRSAAARPRRFAIGSGTAGTTTTPAVVHSPTVAQRRQLFQPVTSSGRKG